jgi:hypothetical protein
LGAVPATQLPMDPGLYLLTSKAESDDAGTQATLENMVKVLARSVRILESMPIEQRKEFGYSADSLSVNADGSVSTKLCITQSQIDEGLLPQQQHAKTCEQKLVISGSKVRHKFKCPNYSGEGRYVFAADGSFTVNVIQRTDLQTKVETTKTTGSARYLDSNCGDVMPVPRPDA